MEELQPPAQAQLIELGNGKRIEFWVVPESSTMAKKISLGAPSARVGAAGFVTLQLPIVSGLWPLSYRVDWQDASGMQASDPTASAWRRINQDSSHPVPIGATSTIANPVRATLRLRTDH